MNFVSKPITQLPEAESVTNDDQILVYNGTDGKAYRARGTLFRGDPATINGVNTLTIDAGENITATQEGDTLHISATDTVYDVATTTDDGLMSAADKVKLDGIASGAEVNVLESVSVNGNAVSVADKTAALTLDKSTVGLGNVDNTSDANKPVSTAQQAALDQKVNVSAVGTANGVAELDSNGKIPAAQLPSYVDDVLEYSSRSAFPATGESGKIYVATDTNLSYRWSGSGYVEISPSIALGETSSTAYRGDRGKTAYDHSQATGNAHSMTKADIGLGNVPNVTTNNQTPTYTAASTLAALASGEKLSVAFGKLAKGVSDLIVHLADNVKHITAAERTAWNNKVDKVSGKGLSTNDYTTAEKQKLEGIESEAQVNEVSAEQYAIALGNISYLSKENQSLRTALNNLIAGLNVPLTMTMSGTKGYLFIEDAAAGNISALTVDSSLSGTTLYIQVRDTYANTMQSLTATVSSTGNVPISGLTVAYGTNQVYVAKNAYVWNNKMSTTIGTDHYPTNGVDFTITYPRDKQLGAEVDKGYLIWDEFLEICGYKVTRTAYASTAAAIAGFNSGETVVVKTAHGVEYSKYNEYAKISQAPLADSTVTYYRETLSLVA